MTSRQLLWTLISVHVYQTCLFDVASARNISPDVKSPLLGNLSHAVNTSANTSATAEFQPGKPRLRRSDAEWAGFCMSALLITLFIAVLRSRMWKQKDLSIEGSGHPLSTNDLFTPTQNIRLKDVLSSKLHALTDIISKLKPRSSPHYTRLKPDAATLSETVHLNGSHDSIDEEEHT